MSKIIKAAVAASMLVFGASTVMAQSNGTNNSGDTVKTPKTAPSTTGNAQPTETQGSGSRAITGDTTVSPNDATKSSGAPDLKKLDKQGRGGQEN